MAGRPPDADVDAVFAPVEALRDELREAGPESVRTFTRFALHLSPEDAAEFNRRVTARIEE